MNQLRLGLFTFRNEDVLLLAGERYALIALAQAIEEAQENLATVAIHQRAQVSPKHPAKLYAVKAPAARLEQGEFYWPCSFRAADEVRSLANAGSEKYFGLSSPLPFLVTAGPQYSVAWWERWA